MLLEVAQYAKVADVAAVKDVRRRELGDARAEREMRSPVGVGNRHDPQRAVVEPQVFAGMHELLPGRDSARLHAFAMQRVFYACGYLRATGVARREDEAPGSPPSYQSFVNASHRLRWTLVVAFAAHAGAFGWSVNAARARTETPEPVATTEMDIDVELPPAGAGSAIDESAPALVRRESVAHAELGRSSASIAAVVEPSSSGRESETPAPSAEPAEGASWSFSPTGPAPGGTLLSSASVDNDVRVGVRATVAEGKMTGDPLKRVLGGFTQHDIDLGLVPGGEFVSLTRNAVRTSRAPTVGHAMLEFQIDSAGAVSAVRVLDASSDWDEWEEVAAEIAKAARGRLARLPSGSGGLALKLEVSSAIQSVTGRAPTDKALTKIVRAIGDPIDAIIDSKVPAQRVVAARIVDAQVL